MDREAAAASGVVDAQWVKAPYKKGVWFERSAHLIPFEEPGKTLVSLLEYVRPLASGAPGAAREGVSSGRASLPYYDLSKEGR